MTVASGGLRDMEITHRPVEGQEDTVIIDIKADFFGHPRTVVLKNHVMHLLQEEKNHLVLNMAGVEMLDSFGIASIISILKLCKENGGNLTLYGLNEHVNRLMEMTHMDRVLDIWETEGQAVSQVK